MIAKRWKKLFGMTTVGALLVFSMNAYASTNITIAKDNVNVRKRASTSASVLTTLKKGEKVTLEATEGEWYKIKSGAATGYVRADLCEKASRAKEEASKAAAASAKQMYIAKENVNVRTKPSKSGEVVKQMHYGDTITVLEETSGWYQVDSKGTTGYIRSDMLSESEPAAASIDDTITQLTVMTEELNAELEDDAASSLVEATEESDIFIMHDEKSATVLPQVIEKLSTTEAQQALKKLGFYYGEPDGSGGKFTTAAIKAFQTAYKISIDGELGTETSAAIQKAVQDGGNGTNALNVMASSNGVILAEWFNGMKYKFPKYEHLRCVDVETGEEFKLRAFSLGNHADVEPPTKEDTDILYRINGNRWTWTPRPIWVYIDGKAYAAAINVQPHGPDTISDNGMKGQICMHFLYSRQHNTGQENKNLQAAVWTAFEAAAAAPAPGEPTVAPVATPVDINLTDEEIFAMIDEEEA